MRYENFIKGVSEKQPARIQDVDPKTLQSFKDIMMTIAEMTEKKIPAALEEQNTALAESEVNNMMSMLLDFKNGYFSDIPMSQTMMKLFIYNIPRPAYNSVKWFMNHPDELPDFMNPLMLIYPFLTDDPLGIMGMWWKKMLQLIDGNREVIDREAKEYMDTRENTDE